MLQAVSEQVQCLFMSDLASCPAAFGLVLNRYGTMDL